jgi:hypothetical protein
MHGEGKMGQCAFVCRAPALIMDAPCMYASACPVAFCGSLRPGMFPHAPCAWAPCRGYPRMCLLPVPGATQALAHASNACNKQAYNVCMSGMLCTALHGFC